VREIFANTFPSSARSQISAILAPFSGSVQVLALDGSYVVRTLNGRASRQICECPKLDGNFRPFRLKEGVLTLRASGLRVPCIATIARDGIRAFDVLQTGRPTQPLMVVLRRDSSFGDQPLASSER
jgi:hypothetical protein